ncbi:MAG: TIM-barrel domain-containing protein [Pseudomonadota bacterium]
MPRLALLALLALAPLVACTPPADTGDTAPAPEPAWPEWAWHHWVWEGESTTESLTEMVDGYEEHGIEVGAVIIDSPWETAYNTFVWDEERFDDPAGLIDSLHARGIRVFLWIVPAINVDAQPLYDEAAAAGYFMQAREGSGPAVITWWKGEGSLLDYFNPEALAWWHAMMEPVLDLGIDGWKCDGLDFSVVIAPYSPGLGRDVTRAEYAEAYYRDFHDFTRERLGDDRVITARPVDTYGAAPDEDDAAIAAFAPVDITWSGWVGDQDSDFGGLKMALRNLYYSSVLGYLAFGSDIGGYRSDDTQLGRDKETFLRWAALGAFCPVMENGGSGEHWPWRFDEETVTIYRSFVDLHHALLPWMNARGAEAFAEGRSLFAFQDDETYEYILGEDLFVAPMIEPGTSRDVTFPEGEDWIWLFGEHPVYAGGTAETLEIPLDTFPGFVREGSGLRATLLPEG